MKKKLRVLPVVLFGFCLVFNSCNENDESISQDYSKSNTSEASLLQSQILTNQNLIDKLTLKLEEDSNGSVVLKESIQNGIKSLQITTSEYTNSDVKSITIPINDDYFYVTYTRGEDIWEGSMLIKVTTSGKSNDVKYFDLAQQELGGFSVTNGEVSDVYGFTSYSTQAKGWCRSWGSCVGRTLNRMTDGSVSGSLVGIACIAFGPECAGGIALSCAATATFR